MDYEGKFTGPEIDERLEMIKDKAPKSGSFQNDFSAKSLSVFGTGTGMGIKLYNSNGNPPYGRILMESELLNYGIDYKLPVQEIPEGSIVVLATKGMIETVAPLKVKLSINTSTHTAEIASGETVTKLDIYNALVSGRVVIGMALEPRPGATKVWKTLECTGTAFGDADGGSAVFHCVETSGAVSYFVLSSLKF